MLPSSDQTMNPQQQPRSHYEQPPNCPRCASTNTKFCYYNNYSLTQPRYFCKGCKRYWTMGGSLRNVPAGSGYRRRRRSRPFKSHSSTQPSDQNQDSPYSNHSSDSSSSTVEIDLAAVFANYFKQDPGPRIQPVSDPDPGLMHLSDQIQWQGLLENNIWSTSQNCTSSDLSTDFTDWDPIVDLKDLNSSPLEPTSAFMADEFQSTEINQVMSDINWSFFDVEDTRALLEFDS